MKKQDPYLELFPDLTKNQFRLLAYMAYYGELHPNDKAAAAYRGRFNLSLKKYNEEIDTLRNLGYIESQCYVKQNVHLKALVCLHRHYAQLALTLSKVYPYSKTSASEYLYKIAQLIVKDDLHAVAVLRRPYSGLGYKQFNLFPYIKELLMNDGRYISLLNENEVSGMVHETLWKSFSDDTLTEDTLTFLKNILPDSQQDRRFLFDEIDGYRFFLTGEKPESTETSSIWTQAIEAICAMYLGKLDDALDLFKSALKMEDGKAKVFNHHIFNYFYGILLCRLYHKHRTNQQALYDYSQFRDSSRIRCNDGNVFIRLVLEYIDIDVTQSKTSILSRINSVISRFDTPLYHSWKYMLCHFFDIERDEEAPSLHTSAIMQHEMSSYIPIGPDAKEKLRNTFGGQSALSTLRKKAPWEVMLSGLTNTLQTKKEEGKRVVYYVRGKQMMSIVEQIRQEDGSWRDGSLLSQSLMASTGYDSMDSRDSAIAMEFSKKTDFQDDIDILVPHLAGTGRLLWGNSYDGHNFIVEIEVEKPYLEFNGQGFLIDISSNVKLDNNGNVKRHTVREIETGRYALVSVNPLQKDIVKRFLSMQHFPSSAATSLKRVIDSLNGIIDVKQNIMESMLQPAVLSHGILAVQVSPDKNEYMVNIQATAMEDGTARFVPAEGEDIVYDEVEGITHCVNRDISLEYENKKELDSFLHEESKAEARSYTEYTIGTAEGLLKLMAYIYDNQDKFFIEWPDGVRLKFRGDIKSSDVGITIQTNTEWFAVEGEVTVGGKKLSLAELVQACSSTEMEGFVRLSDDEYVRMSETLKKHIEAMEAIGIAGHSKNKRVPKYQVGALASMIEGLNTNADDGYSEFLEKTKMAFETEAKIPEGLTAELRDYQKEGFRWMCRLDEWGAGACLADDMGLGKTIQAIAFMLHKASKGPSLVVAPKSVVPNWAQEIARFAPQLNPLVLNSSSKRQGVVKGAGPMDVILCTYGVLGTESQLLQSKNWNVACLDEAHQIKNRDTLVSHAAMDLNAASRIILTGTPLQNHLGELWNLFQFINPGLLGTWPVFRDSFIFPDLDYEHRMLLKEMTQPFILRRTKEDVLLELPEKIVTTHMVELSDNEMKVYEEMRRLAEAKFKKYKTKEEREETKTLDLNFFTELMKLRMAACSMRLVYDRWKEPSTKIMALFDILTNVLSNPKNNVIVFSQFTSLLAMVKTELANRNINYYYLDGQTPLEKRQEMVKDFQEGGKQLFLSSLKAGGVGITLTAANYVILLDPWWNPAIENQAMDRAHRIGQQRVVSVIRLISAQTIEEKILQLHEKKQALTEEILEGTGDSYKLTYEDVMDMVSTF